MYIERGARELARRSARQPADGKVPKPALGKGTMRLQKGAMRLYCPPFGEGSLLGARRPETLGEERCMGLYERLLEEAAQLPAESDREERLASYTRGLRGDLPEGGYVTREELQEELREEQEKRLAQMRTLQMLIRKGPRSAYEGMALKTLQKKYPVEYARMRDTRGLGR